MSSPNENAYACTRDKKGKEEEKKEKTLNPATRVGEVECKNGTRLSDEYKCVVHTLEIVNRVVTTSVISFNDLGIYLGDALCQPEFLIRRERVIRPAAAGPLRNKIAR